MEAELKKYLPNDLAKIITAMTLEKCIVCGNGHPFTFKDVPCSKVCLKKILARNNDSVYANFPEEWLD